MGVEQKAHAMLGSYAYALFAKQTVQGVEPAPAAPEKQVKEVVGENHRLCPCARGR
jgi:hypothetical protein